jgi:predicted transcriptional regulator
MKPSFQNRKRRAKEEIVALIINSAREGASRTRIMNENFLNFKQAKKYVDYALEMGLLYSDSNGKFLATNKGKEYLRRFFNVIDLENDIAEKRKLLLELIVKEEESKLC